MFCSNMNESAAETHLVLLNAYGEDGISEKTFRERFHRFKNGDFNVEDWHMVDERKLSKIQNCTQSLMGTPVKVKKTWHDH